MKATVGPVELEVIAGTVRSAELEIEAAVERTSRSPMIRDQQDVELVNLRVQAVGRANRPEVLKVNKNSDKLIVNSTRSVFWREEGWLDCQIYTRANFPIGISIQGPAIFEEYGSTVVVPRNWSASKDEYGNLKLERIS